MCRNVDGTSATSELKIKQWLFIATDLIKYFVHYMSLKLWFDPFFKPIITIPSFSKKKWKDSAVTKKAICTTLISN